MIYLIIILAFACAGYILYKVQQRKIWHLKKVYEQNTLQLEALLFHSRENEKKAKEENVSLQNFYKQLFSRLNHEIRNPLNGVTGLSALLSETTLTKEQRDHINTIHNCGNSLMEALNQIFKSAGISIVENKPTDDTSNQVEKPKIKLSEEFAAHYPMNILIAEDDKMNQQLSLMILKKMGYTADLAANGKEVLDMVSEKKYDAILMDVQMPEMDGLEATRMIRLCLTKQPAIIAMTANALDGDREACLTAGMDDYISKPVNIEQLMQKLEASATRMKRA